MDVVIDMTLTGRLRTAAKAGLARQSPRHIVNGVGMQITFDQIGTFLRIRHDHVIPAAVELLDVVVNIGRMAQSTLALFTRPTGIEHVTSGVAEGPRGIRVNIPSAGTDFVIPTGVLPEAFDNLATILATDTAPLAISRIKTFIRPAAAKQ